MVDLDIRWRRQTPMEDFLKNPDKKGPAKVPAKLTKMTRKTVEKGQQKSSKMAAKMARKNGILPFLPFHRL